MRWILEERREDLVLLVQSIMDIVSLRMPKTLLFTWPVCAVYCSKYSYRLSSKSRYLLVDLGQEPVSLSVTKIVSRRR